MTEFLLSLLFAFSAIAATSGWLRTEWDRTRCAYLTFEAVHARLTGSSARQSSRVRIEAGLSEVRGTGTCGQAREQLALPRLEREDLG